MAYPDDDFQLTPPSTRAGEPRLPVRFYIEAVRNNFKSDQEGRPIHDEVPFIEINFPGDRTRQIIRPATDIDKQKYAEEYQAFLRLGEKATTGTPLEEWPALSRSDVENLKALRIYNVETLATLSDTAKQGCGFGIQKLVDKAKAFLESAKDTAAAQRLAAQLGERDTEIAFLKEQLSDLARQVKALNPDKGEPDAPPKEVMQQAPQSQMHLPNKARR